MKSKVVQKAIIQNEAGEILILRRSETDVRRPLQWDLPGGAVDPGEGLEDSIRREISEETGLKVSDLKPIYSGTEIRQWKNHNEEYIENVVFIFYLSKAMSTDVKLSYEHTEFAWKPIKDAIKEYKYELHKKILRYIVDNDLDS